MQSNAQSEETFAIVLHMLWECRNVFADLNEFNKSNCIEKCIREIVFSESN